MTRAEAASFVPARPVATLHTQRFTLRPLERADAGALLATFGDEQQSLYLSHPPFGSEEELWNWLADPDWQGRTWIAEDAGGSVAGRFVAVPAHEEGVEEIGFVTCADRQRSGVAFECMSALVRHLFADGARKLVAEVDVENAASIGLLERLGLRREGTLREHETTHAGLRDLHLYGLLAKDIVPGDTRSG